MTNTNDLIAQPKPVRAVPCPPKTVKIEVPKEPLESLSNSNSASSITDEEIKNLLFNKRSNDNTPTDRQSLYTPPNRCENPDISESVFEQSASIAINSPIQEFTGCGLTDLSPPQYSQLAQGFSGW
ncbi:Uncharacterized protein QTN25_009407 [Entamoeba marina]